MTAPQSVMTAPEQWFHSYDFPDGENVTGVKPLWMLKAEADRVFKHGVTGKTVLDIGAWDGFFSFEAEKRGASRVLATDHFSWSGPGWATQAGFDYAHAKHGSKIEARDIDVPDLTPDSVGRFDMVLFLGVLYHLKDPFTILESVSALTNNHLVLETETALDFLPWPVMRYYEGSSLNNDPTNFWAPNRAGLKALLREFGFKRFSFSTLYLVPPSPIRGRVIMHAWKH